MFSKLTTQIYLILLTLIVTGCADQNSTNLARQSLIFCSDGAPDNFNPSMGTSFTNFNASSRVLFDRLLITDNETGQLKPSIALRWSQSDDGLTYTFELREDVEFHHTDWFTPQRNLNADDVIFSFARQADVNHSFHFAEMGSYNYYRSTGLQDNLAAIEKLNDYQIRFQLKQPNDSFLYSLSMDFSSIVSAEYAMFLQHNDLTLNQFDTLPVGTGPFKLNKYQDNTFIRYYAHPAYFMGKPAMEHLIYAITPDPSTRYARLVSGECDVMLNPPKSQFELLLNNKEIKVLQNPGLNIGFMAFNTSKPPLDDLRLRKALTMAINKERIVDKVYGQLGVRNDSLLPPSMRPYHNDSLESLEFDPEAARALLKELEISKLTLDLWSLPVQRSYNPNGMLMAELIQEDLKQVGINATIVSFEWSTQLERVKAGEHDIALLGWVADNYNPSDFIRSLVSCSGIDSKTNRTFWCSEELDNLLDQANSTQDLTNRIAIYNEIQTIIAQQLPLLPVASGESILVARKSIDNIAIQALGGVSFTEVTKDAL